MLVLAPIGRDAAVACRVLEEAGIAARACQDGVHLAREAGGGAGAVVMTEEVATGPDLEAVQALVAAQAAWSDLPLLVFASTPPSSTAGRELVERLQPLGNVTLLERPVHRATLVSAVRAALRARERQYEVRDLLARHERGLRQRDEFLAMLGHELRNPMAAIRNTMSAVELRAESTAQEDVRMGPRERALVHRQLGHLSRLVDDLLDVSRVTSGKVVLRKELVDLAELVSRCAEAVDETARARGLELAVEVGGAPVAVAGDLTRLEQVVMNLLTNAVKYTTGRGHIRLRVAREGGEGVVTVSDTGAGLSTDMLDRVFELFSQAGRTLDRAEGGLGIGLTLVRELVRLHGGEVTAHSAGPARGATFVVRLPLAGAAGEASARELRAPGLSASGAVLRILVVEDNPDNRDSLRLLLEHLGHEVDEAADGPAALDALATHAFDLALVDIGLPGLDGYAVAQRARTAMGDSVHLVALTGYGQAGDRERAREAGFDDHLTKPVDLQVLRELLRDIARRPAPSRPGS